jgi:hypothetical protein
LVGPDVFVVVVELPGTLVEAPGSVAVVVGAGMLLDVLWDVVVGGVTDDDGAELVGAVGSSWAVAGEARASASRTAAVTTTACARLEC